MSKPDEASQPNTDNPEWTDTMVAKAIQIGDLAPALQAKLRGRPKADVTKERITIRISRDVLAQFRASGAGWQTRVDAALKDWLAEHAA